MWHLGQTKVSCLERCPYREVPLYIRVCTCEFLSSYHYGAVYTDIKCMYVYHAISQYTCTLLSLNYTLINIMYVQYDIQYICVCLAVLQRTVYCYYSHYTNVSVMFLSIDNPPFLSHSLSRSFLCVNGILISHCLTSPSISISVAMELQAVVTTTHNFNNPKTSKNRLKNRDKDIARFFVRVCIYYFTQIFCVPHNFSPFLS